MQFFAGPDPPTPLRVNCHYGLVYVSPDRGLPDCISNPGTPPLLEARFLQLLFRLPQIPTFPLIPQLLLKEDCGFSHRTSPPPPAPKIPLCFDGIAEVQGPGSWKAVLDPAQSEVRHVIPYSQWAICSPSFPPGGWQLCPAPSTPPSRKEGKSEKASVGGTHYLQSAILT